MSLVVGLRSKAFLFSLSVEKSTWRLREILFQYFGTMTEFEAPDVLELLAVERLIGNGVMDFSVKPKFDMVVRRMNLRSKMLLFVYVFRSQGAVPGRGTRRVAGGERGASDRGA